MFTAVAVALLLPLPSEPPAKPQPPAVRFRGAENGVLVFELSNPNAPALPYLGYAPNSFKASLKKGTIAPLYRLEVLRGKVWKAHPIGWSGTGLGEETVPGKGKARFIVPPPDGDWQKLRVGVTWYQAAGRKGPAVAWSKALGKDEVAPSKP